MILLTGGSGVLGRELLKTDIHGYQLTRDELNLLKPTSEWDISYFPTLIVHCAAYTDVAKAEQEKELCYQTNVIGTRNLASLGIPMLYISTSYVFDGEKGNYSEEDYPNPINFYSLTKLLGEYEARKNPRSIVLRCLFKPWPFEHPSACIDQYSSGDYVGEVARDIALAVHCFDKLPSTVHIGTGKKSTFELARRSNPSVKPCKIEDIKGVRLPKDVSLNCSKWEAIKKQYES